MKYIVDTGDHDVAFRAGLPNGMEPEVFLQEIVKANSNNGYKAIAETTRPIVQEVTDNDIIVIRE